MLRMKRHGTDMLWKVGTYEESEEEIKKRRNERDTGRKNETDILWHFHIQACLHIQTCLSLTHTTVFYTKPVLLHTGSSPTFSQLPRLAISWRLFASPAVEREKREREREREKCEDRKMWRWEDVKMWRCEDDMCICKDRKMWRWKCLEIMETWWFIMIQPLDH